MALWPGGEMFVSDFLNRRILRFQNGSGDLVADNVGARALFCSPNGVLYVVSWHDARTVAKLVDSRLEMVIASESLPADMQFSACRVFVTKEEVIYLLDDLNENHHRILRVNPGESLEPVVVGQIPTKGLANLFVTDSGTIYVADEYQRKVLALHLSNLALTEVLHCPDGLRPLALLVQDRSLYVSMAKRLVKVVGFQEVIGLDQLWPQNS